MISDLIRQLKDDDKDIRSFAALQLKNIGDKAAIEPLIETLSDNDPVVRQSAIHSLSVLGFNTGKKCVVKYIAHSLNDKDRMVRKEAAMALGTWLLNMIEDIKVVQMLVERLKDDDQEVADRAEFALGNLYQKKNNYDIIRPLLEAENDEDDIIRDKVKKILAGQIRIEKK
ncbi:hypothetical protein CUJ83_09780 [Methanocella sp. CWC-04]|uniref:HEAT repeat-containing protein n=1 Tax=Methanooceanicella nereidis TaxID=2052831 RepID=A0AAP2W6G1_9EURY|nr:HEAT repeat domain-containing protein [Methanocella sp. CWC-04]MCD1295288.1 hypothetical protein [Methanocella sp. CWC-04]